MSQEQTDRAAELLRLPDDEYFELSEERRMEIADALSELGNGESADDPAPIGSLLVLGGPSRVDPVARGKVPVLFGAFQTGLRAWSVNLPPNLRLFVKSRTTGELLQTMPLVSMRRGLQPLPSGVGTPPQGFQAAVTTTSMVLLDLRDRLANKLVAGDILATAVAYDVRSNTVRIRIEGPDRPGPSVAIKRSYVRAELDERLSIDPEIVVPDHGSAKSGLRIRVARQLTEDDGILRTELNQPFLPVHVVLVRLDQPPAVVPASPMVQQVKLPDGRQVFNALFLVELGGETGARVDPGTYRVYLGLGNAFVGPSPLTIGE